MWTFHHDDESLHAHGFQPCAEPNHYGEWARAWRLARAFYHGWAGAFERPEQIWGPVVMSMEDDGQTVVPPVPVRWVSVDGAPVPARIAQAWLHDRDGAFPALSHRSNNGSGRYEWRVDGGATHLSIHRPDGICLNATVRDGRIEALSAGPSTFAFRHVDALCEMLEHLDVDDGEVRRAWVAHGMPWLRLDQLDGPEMLSVLEDAGMKPPSEGDLRVEPTEDGFRLLHTTVKWRSDATYSRETSVVARLTFTDEDADEVYVDVFDNLVVPGLQDVVRTSLDVTLPLVSVTWDADEQKTHVSG